MTKSIYERKLELYKLWSDLKKCLNDDLLSFDKYMELREQEEQSYHQWKFYDNYIKACNKLKEDTPINTWKVVRK